MPDASFTLPDWARVAGPPGASGRLRTSPEDFRVWEIPLLEPDGAGSHLWLEIEKRNTNTSWVAEQLARAAGVRPVDVGFAGMKDRRGVTTQWFSVALQEAAHRDWRGWRIQDIVINRAESHTRKLKRGALRGNRFRIVVRDLSGDLEDLERRLRLIEVHGAPNYFGPQRFGHGGLNVTRGARWLQHGGRLSRNRRSIYLSALRSFLFNEVLSERVKSGSWNRLLDGEIAALDGSRSTFACEPGDTDLASRCERFDIHPSGPLPGRGGPQPTGDCLALERSVLTPHGEIIDGLEKAGLEAARRSLRLRPLNMDWKLNDNDLRLDFELANGVYATSLIRELVTTHDDSISE